MQITFDKLFTYWVFVWFLVYYYSVHTKDVHVKIPSPIIGLYVGLVENLVVFISFITTNTQWIEWLKYIIIILFTKGLPIYLIRNQPVVWSQAIYSFFALFLVYLLYLQWLGTNVIEVYKETEKSLTQGKNNTPIYRLIDQISKFIRT